MSDFTCYTIEATGFADDIWATCNDKRGHQGFRVQPNQQFVRAEDAAAALAEEQEKITRAESCKNAWRDEAHKYARERDALAARVKKLEAELYGATQGARE